MTWQQLLIVLAIPAIFITMRYLQRTKTRTKTKNKKACPRQPQTFSMKEVERMNRMRGIHLSLPLSEKTRPIRLTEVIGQEEGLKVLKTALCGPYPQHVIIYGPPGVGKTAAARLVLDEAKHSLGSPFAADAPFVEVDGATSRFDERGIADPLIGSVHDPIYQGAGSLGQAGIPQPKLGAVSRAHGGILFIDEIGELHSTQINKLLKVLEDRKIILESSYYNPDDDSVPAHIKDIFENGAPADFRLIAATTRQREEIPAAIRSRCLEIFFRPLTPAEVEEIATNASAKLEMRLEPSALALVGRYASNGRDAVNMIQLAAGLCSSEGINSISAPHLEWALNSGHYLPRIINKIPPRPMVGVVNGLSVVGTDLGVLLELEASVRPSAAGGSLKLTGVIDEEEVGLGGGRSVRRRSQIRNSVENVLTVLKNYFAVDSTLYDIHINFPGGIPVDGPSAGLPIAAALYSAFSGRLADNKTAMTGEISIRGEIKPVGGIIAKVEAARTAGVTQILLPRENYLEIFDKFTDCRVIPVGKIGEVLDIVLHPVAPPNNSIGNSEAIPASETISLLQ